MVNSTFGPGSAADVWRQLELERAQNELKKEQIRSGDLDFRASLRHQEFPTYESLVKNGQLDPAFTLAARPDVGFTSNLAGLDERLAGIQLDKRGLDALRERALATGPSTWAQLMLEREGVERGGRLDEAGRLANAATSAGFSAAASRGGIREGQKARLAKNVASNLMKSRQDIGRQSSLDRLGILTKDEDQRLDLLKSLPGIEVQALEPELRKTSLWSNMADSEAGRRQSLDLANRAYGTDVDRFNLGTKLTDRQRAQDFRLKEYEEKMKAWAADRTAQAQEDAGPSWICGEIDKTHPFNKGEWASLMKFKRWCIKNDRARAEYYFDTGKNLLPKLRERGFEFSNYRWIVKNTIQLIDAGRMTEAADLYWSLLDAVLRAGFPTDRAVA